MSSNDYTSSVEPAEYFGLHSGRIGSGFRGMVVRASNNTVAWRSRIYDDKRAALLQANRMKPRYQYHLDKHGVGFEEQQAVERAAKEAARVAADERRNRLRDNGEAMLDALAKLLCLAEAYAPREGASEAKMAEARAIIARIQQD